MAAAVVGTINADSIHDVGRFRGQRIMVIPLTVSNTNTHQLEPGMNPTRVAWQANASTDWAVAILAASTGVVTISTDGVSDPHTGNLIVWYGGESA